MRGRSGRKRACVRVDVIFPDDMRLMRIPLGVRRARAIGTWLAALCHARQFGLDGFCPTEALHAFAVDEVIQDLVDVGLFVRGEQHGLAGVVVVNDAEEIDRLPWDEQLHVTQVASDEAKAKHGRRAS